MSQLNSFTPSLFYGEESENERYKSRVSNYVEKQCSSKGRVEYKMKDLVNGPSLIWRIFRKQHEALEFMTEIKTGVMAFAFEQGVGRLFLVAHPEVFWHYDEQSPPSCRCTYEIIPELSTCKLYFDLEFDKILNPLSDGPEMVLTLISIVNFYLKKLLNVSSKFDKVLILDSSTEVKFSRHLIFNICGTYFFNNYHAGNFVSYICQEIRKTIESNCFPEGFINGSLDDFKRLLVKDSKDKIDLFIDESVYSKNRQFRLFKSSKYGKCSPLLISFDNKFVPQCGADEKEIFLSSLITYVTEENQNLIILHFNNRSLEKRSRCSGIRTQHITSGLNSYTKSPYPLVDDFINTLVSPGKIYRCGYFSSLKLICYDIVGNRFCGNIGRQHKSNNVKYIVNLCKGIYYQKCYDYDCSNYKSEERVLPISLHLNDIKEDTNNNSSPLGSFADPSSKTKSLEKCEQGTVQQSSTQNRLTFQRFPSFDLHDEDFQNIQD